MLRVPVLNLVGRALAIVEERPEQALE